MPSSLQKWIRDVYRESSYLKKIRESEESVRGLTRGALRGVLVDQADFLPGGKFTGAKAPPMSFWTRRKAKTPRSLRSSELSSLRKKFPILLGESSKKSSSKKTASEKKKTSSINAKKHPLLKAFRPRGRSSSTGRRKKSSSPGALQKKLGRMVRTKRRGFWSKVFRR